MNKLYIKIFICCVFGVLCFSPTTKAQFRDKAFTQNYNNASDTVGRDSADVVFTFKDYFGGLAHKHESKIGVVFAGSLIFVGGQQIYNKQYWKLPLVYGGMAATTGLGIYYRNKWNKTQDANYKTLSNLYFAGAGLVYWATLMDGVINYKKGVNPHPGRSTLYSLLLPGLGQAYNGEFWKIPIYYTALATSAHFIVTNNTNYNRFKNIYNDITTGKDNQSPITAETALYYRNVYRRYRDYAIVGFLGIYILQVIDANVFSYMQDFELSDNIALKLSPTIITNDLQINNINQYNYALHSSGPINGGIGGFGLKVGITF